MRNPPRPLVLVVAIAAILAFAPGCSLFKVQGSGFVKTTVNGQTVVDKQVKFDSLEEMPGAMRELGGAMAQTTELLVEKLVEAPPPGEVRLADIDPTLAQFENDPSVNFLLAGKSLEQPMASSTCGSGCRRMISSSSSPPSCTRSCTRPNRRSST